MATVSRPIVRLGYVDNPFDDLLVVQDKVVEMVLHPLGGTSYRTHWVAEVAVVEEDVRVRLQRGELCRGAGTATVEGLAVADGEVLVATTDHGTKGSGCDDLGETN